MLLLDGIRIHPQAHLRRSATLEDLAAALLWNRLSTMEEESTEVLKMKCKALEHAANVLQKKLTCFEGKIRKVEGKKRKVLDHLLTLEGYWTGPPSSDEGEDEEGPTKRKKTGPPRNEDSNPGGRDLGMTEGASILQNLRGQDPGPGGLVRGVGGGGGMPSDDAALIAALAGGGAGGGGGMDARRA